MELRINKPQPKQHAFMTAKTRFVAFGGARGGGKSWAVRAKASLLGVRQAGIRMLLLRKTYAELQDNHVLPLQAMLKDVAKYSGQDKAFTFVNGSRLKLGYLASDNDVLQYQGQEYDVIFMDEATQFTEFMFTTLTASLRGANNFPKRFYLTCNPGGVGHEWVKRLFVTKEYKSTENPADYTFIQSLVYDNTILMRDDPGYVKMLENLSDNQRKAWLYGDWDIFDGQYFPEFDRSVHVCEPFAVPQEWRMYRTLDYGLDMLACYWIAIDGLNNVYVTKELCQSNLPISSAAAEILDYTSPNEDIYATLAPPDLWSRTQETGKGKDILFSEAGLTLTKSNNEREAGWLAIKELLKLNANGEARLKIFSNCRQLIKHLPALQHDDKRPTDVSNEPHEITHSPDALRYFAIYWTHPADIVVKEKKSTLPFELRDDSDDDYYSNNENEYMEW